MEPQSSHIRSREMNSEQDGCGNSHRPSLLLRTGPGSRLCLLCVSSLIADKDAFLIHRMYAVEELSMALNDALFSSALFSRHPKIFVSSLPEAVGSSTDEKFSQSITALILSLCRLSRDCDECLVEDFIRQSVRQLECSSLWSRSKCCTLHLIGLLLELHCQQELRLPLAIRNQKDFVPNLIIGLQLPGEGLQEEIFYILYKIASLEDGVEQFLRNYSLQLCQAAIHTLLKTESDSLRINCIALLSVMASRSIFDIRFTGGNAPGRERDVHSSRRAVVYKDSSSVHTFAEAMKASLLSSDLQVQASALQLIHSVFPEGVYLNAELQVLVEGGLVDYIFEIIRLSEKQEKIKELAVDVLILFSAEEHIFPHRFKVGLDTVIRVLEQSIDAHSMKLQTSILLLLSRSLSDITETLSTPRAEHLLLLLAKFLQNQAKAVGDHALIGDSLPPTFNAACLALISLTQAPSCTGISNVHRILETATVSAIITASSAAKINPDPSSLRYAASLLQEVYKFNKKLIAEDDAAATATEALIQLCELYLLPAFTDNLEKLDDEKLVLAFLQTFTLILKTELLESTYRFASKLTSNRCFTLCFELMGRFPSRQFKESAYKFLSALVNQLAGCSIEAYIEESLEHLASDPTDLLIQVEQGSAGNEQMLLAHRASIAILSTSYSFNDRLAKETDIVASLEQHLLINHGSTLALEATLRQFISLYAGAKDALKDLNGAWSEEAEKILEVVVGRLSCGDLFCSETPKPVLKWFLRKDSLKDVNMVQLLTWFTAVQKNCFEPREKNSSALLNSCKEEAGSEFLVTLAELIGIEDCGTTALVSLFDTLVVQGKDDDIRIVARTFTQLARMSVPVGHQLIRHGLMSTLQQMIRTYSSKATDSTMASCLELLFQLLYDSDTSHEAMMSSRSWMEIANQCATLVMRKTTCDTSFEVVVAPLSVINLILQRSYENDFFAQASEVLLCNSHLCAKLEAPILDASSQGAKLSQMVSKSVEEELLSSAVIFCLWRLRCAIRFVHQMELADEKQYIGFNPSVNGNNCSNGSTVSTISLTCEHWCRVLYFGPPSLKALACCCIAEIFSQLTDSSKSTQNKFIGVKELGIPTNFLMAVTMVLQSSILGDSERMQEVSSCCLSQLLCSKALSLEQKQAVASSPWNHMLLENLVLSLSSSNFKQNPGTVSFSAAYVAVGLLKMSPPQSYLPSLFSEASITSICSNLCEADVSPIIVSLFHELLLSRYLTDDHVRSLRDLFQATRKKIYGRVISLHLGDRQSNAKFASSKILNVDRSSSYHIIHSAVLELAITSRDKALKNISNNANDAKTSHVESCAFTSLIDTFMQESDIQFK